MNEFKQGIAVGMILASVVAFTKAIQGGKPEDLELLKGMATELMGLLDKVMEELR